MKCNVGYCDLPATILKTMSSALQPEGGTFPYCPKHSRWFVKKSGWYVTKRRKIKYQDPESEDW